MKWIKDKTGRFPERLYFENGEIDSECELIIRNFFSKELGISFTPPFTIEQLEILINTEIGNLDLYADLSKEGDDVEGLTEFAPGKKPFIKISSLLSSSETYKNRLKSTMAHELFHAKFHNLLWALKWSQEDLFGKTTTEKIKCHRKQIVGAGQTDWIEWQAAYGSGAFTMPKSFLLQSVKDFRKTKNMGEVPIECYCETGHKMITHISTIFQISDEAAKIRLLQLGFIYEKPATNLIISY